jgi:hypothetical protein
MMGEVVVSVAILSAVKIFQFPNQALDVMNGNNLPKMLVKKKQKTKNDSVKILQDVQ